MKLLSILLLTGFLGTVAPLEKAFPLPPAKPKPLLAIVLDLEKQGYGPIVEASLDRENWEIEAYKGDVSYELVIDSQSGKILSEHRDDANAPPPADSKPLSQILQGLEDAGYSPIIEVSFERRHWEIEAYRERTKREVGVDPQTGKILFDRIDD